MSQVFLKGADCRIDMVAALTKIETQMITEALKLDGNNQTKAAERLGIKRSTLCEKIRRLGVRL